MHQIRYFLAVSETLSFTRAAERCRVSQPTLTAAIQKLEKELGGALLLRERSGSKLTPLGRSILPRLRRIENEQQSVSLIAENHRKLKQVPLRIGVLRTLGPSRLCADMATFRAVAPGVEVELFFGSREVLPQQLEEAEVELLLTTPLHPGSPPDGCVVAAGVGIAFMPEHSVLPGLGTGRPLVDPDPRRTVCLMRSADRSVPPAAKLFWRTLLAATKPASQGA